MLIRISREKMPVGSLLFFLALALYIIRFLIRASLLLDLLPGSFSRMLTIAVLLLLLIKVFVDDRYPGKLVVSIFAILLFVLLVVYKGGYSSLVTQFVLILSAYNVKFDGILKCTALAIVISTLIVVAACGVGLVPDYTFSHNVVSFIDEGHSLGFTYYSTLGNIVMTLTAIFLYFRRNCRYIVLLLLAAINFLLFLVHTTTLPLIVGLVMIVAYIFTVKIHWFKLKAKIWRVVAAILTPACFVINLGLVILYKNGKFNIDAPSFSTLMSRFRYSAQALDEYGIHWLGTKVEMSGRTATTYGDAESYFYIDSAYMRILIAYGILLTAVIIILYMIMSQYVFRLQDPYLFVWFAVIVIICMINNFILTVALNPFLFLIVPAILKLGRRRGT